MSANYREAVTGIPREELEKYARGIKLVNKFVDSLQSRSLLPERFAKAGESSIATARSSEALPHRLKPIPFEIEIPRVRAEIYAETRKAVEETGAFITTIQPFSIEDLLALEEPFFQRRFNHKLVYHSDTMRATVPPKMEVFINPLAVRIDDSNELSTDEQKAKILEAEMRFKDRFPSVVRSFVSLNMVDPSTYSQLEDAWMDAGNGLLFPDYFVRTDVPLVEGHVATVGRPNKMYGQYEQRSVRTWYRDHGHPEAFAVPVGILPKISTA